MSVRSWPSFDAHVAWRCWNVLLASRRTTMCIAMLLDNLVGSREHRRWDRQAEGLGGLEIDHQLERCRLLNREVGGLGAFEDLVDVISRAAKHVRKTGRVGYQAACVHEVSPSEGGWQSVFQ